MAASPQSVRLVDVADRAGVSRAAVAKALLGTGGDKVRVGARTSERIRRIAREMGYVPNRAARQLKGISSRTLGVVLDTDNTPVMTDRLFALEQEASRRGYRLLIGRTHHRADEIAAFLDEFESRVIDGLICLFDQTKGFDQKVRGVFQGRPRLLFHGASLTPDGFCVRVDTADAIRQLVDHLHARGYRRIGMGLEHLSDKLIPVRQEAYRAALAAHGMPVREEWIWNAPVSMPDPAPEAIDTAIDHLVGRHRLDAIIASNDLWAVRFIQRLKARGIRVPDGVAVTGYDNLSLATVIDPPLTTIDQRHVRYARAVLDLLVPSAPNPPGDRTRVIPPRLIVRHSS